MAYWNLDEAGGFVRSDATGHGFDLAEWSFAQEQGMGSQPIGNLPGILGDSADFGSNYTDDSASKGLVSRMENTLATGNFSFSFWFTYSTENSCDGQALFSVGGGVLMGIRAFDASVNFVVVTDTDPGYCEVRCDNNAFSEYTWTHAGFVKEGNTLRIYINGVEQGSTTFAGMITPVPAGYFNATDLILGVNPWGYQLIGMLDEAGCWQRALSASDMAQLYNYGCGLPYEWF